ncbi:MAG: glycosyltransferase family 4 protein [Polyangiaceae bacterium]|nr:glycosyltransferase family 4 protein [Polyangiaceae bacterium]
MSEPSPVVHVVVAGEVGGAERMLIDLARGNTDRPHTVALMTPSKRLRDLLLDARLTIDDRGTVREGPLPYIAQSLGPRDAAWLSQVISSRRAKIAHLHTFGSQVLGTRAARRMGSRIVRTEHSTRVYDDLTCWPFSRWSLRRANAVVCISEHVRRVAVARAPWAACMMQVVPNGVDLEKFVVAQWPDDPPDNRVRFVSVGRLEPRKGTDIALQALAHVPNAVLDIVGEGDDRDKLEKLRCKLGVTSRVRFLGFLSDVRQAVANADLALSSARAEGLGIALLEAMAAGRAVVALPTGGIPEFVKDGETGWLARCNSVEALIDAMRNAASAGREAWRTLGNQARAVVAARYSTRAMRAGYERTYAAVDRGVGAPFMAPDREGAMNRAPTTNKTLIS